MNWYCEAGDGPNGPGEDLGVFLALSAADCVSQCAAGYSNRQDHMCHWSGYDQLHTVYYCEAESGPNGAGEDLGTFMVLNSVADGAADCVAQCAADYSNRQGHMCSDQGYGTFHVNWYCEAGDGPRGPGEDLGVFLAIGAADCVSQCAADYSNRQDHMCHWAGYDQFHTAWYCDATSGPKGPYEPLGRYLVLKNGAEADNIQQCLDQCTSDYGHNRQGLMCNPFQYGWFFKTWYCEAGNGENLQAYLSVNKDDCLTQCVADYGNRVDHECNDVGYDSAPVPIWYCEASDGEDLGTFLVTSGSSCLSACISAYSTRSGHMCNDVAYGHLFSTYYCEAGLGENLGTFEAISAADCVAQCAADYPTRENHQCTDEGYDHLPIPSWYCEAGSGEDLGTFAAAAMTDCIHQCTTTFSSKSGHTCSTGGYSIPWLTWTGGPGGGYCSRVTWYCESTNGDDLAQYEAFDEAECIDGCTSTFPGQNVTCNDVGYGFRVWYCEAGDGEDLDSFAGFTEAECISQCTSAFASRAGHMCSDVGFVTSTYYCEAGDGPNGPGEDLAQIPAISEADCIAQCAVLYVNREGHMCNSEGYGYLHSDWYCEAANGPNGIGEDLQVYAAISAADCVTQCAIDYSNRIGHMCSDVGYDTFYSTYYCEAGSGPRGPGEDLGVFLAISAADCVSQCAVDYSNRANHMCNNVAYDYLFATYYCEAGSGPNGPGENLGRCM